MQLNGVIIKLPALMKSHIFLHVLSVIATKRLSQTLTKRCFIESILYNYMISRLANIWRFLSSFFLPCSCKENIKKIYGEQFFYVDFFLYDK